MSEKTLPHTSVHTFFGAAAPSAGLAAARCAHAFAEATRQATPLSWRPTQEGWSARVRLPELPAGTLLVPSLMLGTRPPTAYAMRFEWGRSTHADAEPCAARGAIDLAPILVDPAATHPWASARMDTVAAGGVRARGGLDCIEVLDAIDDAELVVQTQADALCEDASLLVSHRPLRVDVVDGGETAPAIDVPALSQQTRDPAIASHICSPISIAMVLGARGRIVDPEAFARGCEHPDHARLFGMWPLNLARAHSEGLEGLVRAFESAEDAVRCLAAGMPIVASIRFEPGGLPDAPLPRTGGHLVVLRGLTSDHALVNDPAAPTDAEVERRYDRAAFLRAWLADRGVGYVLWSRSEQPQRIP